MISERKIAQHRKTELEEAWIDIVFAGKSFSTVSDSRKDCCM